MNYEKQNLYQRFLSDTTERRSPLFLHGDREKVNELLDILILGFRHLHPGAKEKRNDGFRLAYGMQKAFSSDAFGDQARFPSKATLFVCTKLEEIAGEGARKAADRESNDSDRQEKTELLARLITNTEGILFCVLTVLRKISHIWWVHPGSDQRRDRLLRKQCRNRIAA